jgi:hypothetical protein
MNFLRIINRNCKPIFFDILKTTIVFQRMKMNEEAQLLFVSLDYQISNEYYILKFQSRINHQYNKYQLNKIPNKTISNVL